MRDIKSSGPRAASIRLEPFQESGAAGMIGNNTIVPDNCGRITIHEEMFKSFNQSATKSINSWNVHTQMDEDKFARETSDKDFPHKKFQPGVATGFPNSLGIRTSFVVKGEGKVVRAFKINMVEWLRLSLSTILT